MTPWLIVRTEAAKEHFVAKEIVRLGLGEAWVPVEIRSYRTAVVRKHRGPPQTKEYPLLPKRLFAAVPVALQGVLATVRHLAAIERGSDATALQIPAHEIALFRARVAELNADTLALCKITTRKQKRAWKSMKEALEEMIGAAKTEMEMAA